MSRPTGIAVSRRALVSGLLAALFVVCWSSGFVGAKLGTEDASVTTVLMWRFLPAAALMVLLVRILRRGSRPPEPLTPRLVCAHVVIGLLSQAGYLVTVYGAIALGVSTGTTALIDGIQPLVAAALVGPLLGVAVTGHQWAGLVVGLAGVALVTWADATAPTTDAPGWAYLVPLVGMLVLIGSTIIERRTRPRISAMTALTIHCLTSAALFTGAGVLTGSATPPSSGGFWLATAWLVLLATLGGYGLYWVLLERMGVTPVNSLMFLIAPVTAVWGALMFAEPFTPATAAGLGLALVAALVVVRSGPARRPDVGGPDADGRQGGGREDGGREDGTTSARHAVARG